MNSGSERTSVPLILHDKQAETETKHCWEKTVYIMRKGAKYHRVSLNEKLWTDTATPLSLSVEQRKVATEEACTVVRQKSIAGEILLHGCKVKKASCTGL